MNVIKSALVMMAVLLVTSCAPKDNASLINSKKAAVVAIIAEKNQQKPTDPVGGLGTGWFLKENYILTNFHVAGNMKALKVVATENSDKAYDAEFVYGDEMTDIAVVRVSGWNDWNEFKKKYDPKYLKLVDRDDIHVAEEVWAIGHPWGLGWSVSRGIISNITRKRDNSPNYLLQTDARIFNGNSGGPLLDKDGNVLGMNDLMIVNEGGSYGMSIPSPIIRKVIKDLEKYGEVRWSVIGVSLDEECVVKDLTENRPAIYSGMKVGDRILAIRTSERDVEVTSLNQLTTEIGLADSDQELTLRVRRGDAVFNLSMKPAYNTSSSYRPIQIQ